MEKGQWKQLLKKNPIFSTIHDERKIDAFIDTLLIEGVSKQRDIARGEDIVRQSDPGDSLYVIGFGSADVLLEVGGGPPIQLSTMGTGDVFGEMAFFEQRSRAATVRAKEACTVLEIPGSDFQKVLGKYPEIRLELLLLMGQRLRQTNDQILALHLKTVDERLELFNKRLETDQRVAAAELKAAQAMFDQTKLRADEVISSAERSRDRLNRSATIVGALVTVLVTILGVLGLKEVLSMEKLQAKTAQTVQDVEKYRDEAKRSAAAVENSATAVEEAKKKAEKSLQEVEKVKADQKRSVIGIYRPRLFSALDRGAPEEAFREYQQLRDAGALDEEQFGSLILWMESQVVAKAPQPPLNPQQLSNVGKYFWLFQQVVVDAPAPRDKLDAYYLLLVYSHLTDQKDFPKRDKEEYKNLATRQDARAALEKYVKSAGSETQRTTATEELAKRIEGEPGKRRDDLNELSRVALVSLRGE